MKTLSVLLIGMIWLAADGKAQSGYPLQPDSLETIETAQPVSSYLKKPSKAIIRSLTHTAVPIGLALAINAAAPPEIHLFSDEEDKNTGSLLFMLLGLSYGSFIGPSMGNLYARDYLRGFGGIALRIQGVRMMRDSTPRRAKRIGQILFFGSALYNILSGPASVRRYNRRQKLQIAPSVDPGTQVPVLSVRVHF